MPILKDHKQRARAVSPITLSQSGSGTETELPSEIQVLPLGAWDTPYRGEIVITRSDCQEFIDNFNSKKFLAGGVAPIDLDHNGAYGVSTEAAGWINGLKLKENEVDPKANGLYALVEWTPLGAEKLTSKQYRFYSSELWFLFEDPLTGDLTPNVLTGGGLTNRPFFRDMTPAGFSAFSQGAAGEKSDIALFIDKPNQELMDLQAILQKDPSALTEEEKTFLADHKAELTEEQRTQFGIAEEAPAEEVIEEEKKEEIEVEEEKPEEKPAEEEEKPDGMTASVTMTAAEKATFDAELAAGRDAIKKVRRMEFAAVASTWVFDAAGKGKFPPRLKDKVVSFMERLPEGLVKEFSSLFDSMPDLKIFAEMGSGDDTPTDASSTITTLATKRWEEYLEKNPSGHKTYSEFVLEVAAEKPELNSQLTASEDARMASLRGGAGMAD